jgi:hypothetical protein
MIEFVFTIDYEIYGNGQGSLRNQVYEPTKELITIFNKRNAKLVVFPEVAELEIIEASGADPAINMIRDQLSFLHRHGYELGLHIHPWWDSAERKDGRWILNYGRYNMGHQNKDWIDQILDRSITYLRRLINDPDFNPISFRAGHLIFQPTQPLSSALVERGIKVDSSVYKGGLWHKHNLDYRRAPKNEYYWKFTADITKSESDGEILEVPIHTHMAPTWTIFTSKRTGLQQKGKAAKQTATKVFGRLRDIMRFRYPLKYDLGQMTRSEVTQMMTRTICIDQKSPTTYRPIVVIMHTKDEIDLSVVDNLLEYLEHKHIKTSTLAEVHKKIMTFE